MDFSRLRIAIADDDRGAREVLLALLSKLGHDVVVIAETGTSLIQQCEAVHPDAVITDNNMPEMSGIEAAGIIYDKDPIPIVLLSAFCSKDSILNAERKHVLIYLVKPVNQAHLEIALSRCHEQRAALQNQLSDTEPASGPSRSSLAGIMIPRLSRRVWLDGFGFPLR